MRAWTFRIPLVWLVVGPFLIIEVLLLAFFIRVNHEAHEEILFGASIVGGAFALYTYLKGIEERRTMAADELIKRWNDPSFNSMKRCIREICEETINPSDLFRAKKGEHMEEHRLLLRSELVAILGLFEEIALLINTSGVNEEKLKRFFGPAILQAHAYLESWIDNERKMDREDGYYIELQTVVAKWKKEKASTR